MQTQHSSIVTNAVSERLPSFLIIGAAKSGTTTLFADLESHPDIFFPVIKEPADLTRDEVLDPAGCAKYARLFADAKPGQLLGEASTAYTASPMFEGAARRARTVLGSDLKLIYLVRDPYERVLSEHRYSALLGKLPGDINVAMRETPRMIERSRYAHQLRPWFEQFGAEQLRVLVFEHYVKNRESTVASLFAWLGASVDPNHRLPETKNRTTDVVIPRGILDRVAKTDLYRRTIRRLVPADLRERTKRFLGRPSKVTVDQKLTAEHARQLHDQLAPDVAELHRMLGWKSPVWPRFAGAVG